VCNIHDVIRTIPIALANAYALCSRGPETGDVARGHILHYIPNAVWFDLNIIIPIGIDRTQVVTSAEPFEALMVRFGGIAHPHKGAINRQQVSFRPETKNYLKDFQHKYDATGKMTTPAIQLD
jgi:hypothetical protein